jgi:hypothetical protein
LIKLFDRRFDDTVVRLARRAKRALPKDHKTGEGDVINGNDEVLTTCWSVKGVPDRWEDYYHIGHGEPICTDRQYVEYLNPLKHLKAGIISVRQIVRNAALVTMNARNTLRKDI